MRTVFTVSTFPAVPADVFGHLSGKVAGITGAFRLLFFLGIVLFATLVGAVAAHVLLSLLQGTDLSSDLIQEEPVEQPVN